MLLLKVEVKGQKLAEDIKQLLATQHNVTSDLKDKEYEKVPYPLIEITTLLTDEQSGRVLSDLAAMYRRIDVSGAQEFFHNNFRIIVA